MRKVYKIILMVISILLIGSIIIGTSYSMWVKTAIQKEQNIVNSSCFDIEFTESSNINLTNAIPISDEAGLKKKPYTFTLKNTCNMNSKVSIALDVLSTSTMSSSAIKTSLTKGNKSGTPTLLTSLDKKADVDISGAKEAYILGTDIIGANKSKSYSLYLWMDEAVTVAEASKSFSSKVVIVNTATEEEPPLTLAEKVAALATTDTTQIATDDPDNNIRYIGANPNNYVYFNCSDYNNQSDSTCEKWRIIGVFKNMTKEDGTKEDLVKIIRDDRLSNTGFSWDYKKKGVGTSTSDYSSNDWTDSQLMMMLNPTDYLKSGYTIDNNIIKDSKGQAIYQNMGSYYNGTTTNRESCLAKELNNWDGSGVSDCKNNDYLFKSAYTQWTLAPSSSASNVALGVYSKGYVGSSNYVSSTYGVRPAAYLKSSISLSSVGDGSSTSPYQLKVG